MRYEEDMEKLFAEFSEEETAQLLANLEVGEDSEQDKIAVLRIRSAVQDRVSAENAILRKRKIRRIVMPAAAIAACLAVVLTSAYVWNRNQTPPIDVVVTSTEPSASATSVTTEKTVENIASSLKTTDEKETDDLSGDVSDATVSQTSEVVTGSTESVENTAESDIPDGTEQVTATTQTVPNSIQTTLTTLTTTTGRTTTTSTATKLSVSTSTTSTTTRRTTTTTTTKRTTPTTTTGAQIVTSFTENACAGGEDSPPESPTGDRGPNGGAEMTTETTTTEDTADMPRGMAEIVEEIRQTEQ